MSGQGPGPAPDRDRERLLAQATAWRAEDPDPRTVGQLDDLLVRVRDGDADALAELGGAFSGPLEFGTAGLRGPMGPGPARMNRVVVIRASAGLARYLLDTGRSAGPVLVGHDARHGSAAFARDTAATIAGHGLDVLLVDGPIPTPVVAYGIRALGCVAAVVVTASHNPAPDNGYKVYLGDGSQIVPPADARIAARIAEAGALPLATLPRSDDWRDAGPELLDGYVARAAGLVAALPAALSASASRRLRWVYTPMHGVGLATVRRVVRAAGLPEPAVVEAQADPDPDFPTVAFPNPEEPGALDLAMGLAREVGADLVVANDPDADRCAVAVPRPEGWRMLRGDELGALLGADLLRRGVAGTYASSVVSSTLLATMARAAGAPYVTTLTGFKWIGRVPGLVYGYEEALGYCCDPAAVADKDGITTLVRVLDLAGRLADEGRTLTDLLDDVMRTHGLHATDQLAFRSDRVEVISGAMQRLRTSMPATLGGEPLTVTDLAAGTADLPATDAVVLQGGTLRVVVRPSGTEPKLKCYLEVRSAPEASVDLEAARILAAGRLRVLRTEVAEALGLG
ncbi:phosphomannomutase [Raineyella antarctica]|uniref:Phosphomannomutase n=1 Tax=Raineyella antarctica TaxID=1577474 RepID=A0A1G6H4R7_9ACTN|nr:phospho-sugar mutase [Raineyella antarctica]SDB89171.1 phosphomannomutase [Raineyella antarctica]